VNEVKSYRLSVEAPSQAHAPLIFVHGVSFIDERLAMIPTAKSAAYGYDKAGNRITMLHHGGGVTATYNYDTRDRCTRIAHNGATLADYTWLGNSLSRRDTTCDYPGSTKPKFKSDFARDGLQRITKLVNEHLTYDQAGSTYGDLGTWDYTYDSGGNLLTSDQTGTMGGSYLTVDNFHTYDTGDRLLTTRYDDLQGWVTPHPAHTSWFSYDDLGNRISHKYRAASAIGYAHDKANRMTTLANRTQGYDPAGNLTLAYSVDRGTSYVYRYDHHNRLTGVYDSTNTTRKAAFTWDALGRRVEFWNDPQQATTRKAAFTLDMQANRGSAVAGRRIARRCRHVKGSPGMPWAVESLTTVVVKDRWRASILDTTPYRRCGSGRKATGELRSRRRTPLRSISIQEAVFARCCGSSGACCGLAYKCCPPQPNGTVNCVLWTQPCP